MLRAENLVSAKRDLARTLAGDASVASRSEWLRQILKAWLSVNVKATPTDHALVASVTTASEPGFIAVGYLSEMPVMLIGRDTNVTTALDAQIAACLLANGDETAADNGEYEKARRAIQKWSDCDAASNSAGITAAPPPSRKHLLSRLDATVQNAPPHLRASRLRIASTARMIASGTHGAAVEQELDAFMESEMSDDDWLNALASVAVRPQAVGTDTRFELRALLLLRS